MLMLFRVVACILRHTVLLLLFTISLLLFHAFHYSRALAVEIVFFLDIIINVTAAQLVFSLHQQLLLRLLIVEVLSVAFVFLGYFLN